MLADGGECVSDLGAVVHNPPQQPQTGEPGRGASQCSLSAPARSRPARPRRRLCRTSAALGIDPRLVWYRTAPSDQVRRGAEFRVDARLDRHRCRVTTRFHVGGTVTGVAAQERQRRAVVAPRRNVVLRPDVVRHRQIRDMVLPFVLLLRERRRLALPDSPQCPSATTRTRRSRLPDPEDVATRLGAKREGDHWIARCSLHDDRTPSLKIGRGRSHALVLTVGIPEPGNHAQPSAGATARLFIDSGPMPSTSIPTHRDQGCCLSSKVTKRPSLHGRNVGSDALFGLIPVGSEAKR